MTMHRTTIELADGTALSVSSDRKLTEPETTYLSTQTRADIEASMALGALINEELLALMSR